MNMERPSPGREGNAAVESAVGVRELPRWQVPAVEALERAGRELRHALAGSEQEIGALTRRFLEIAGSVEGILKDAGLVSECVSDSLVGDLLTAVESLGAASQESIRVRLLAAGKIGETLGAESQLLGKLVWLARRQSAMVRETAALRVLTRIEVSRLEGEASGFQQLAAELDEFSKAMERSIGELRQQTDERRLRLEELKRSLPEQLARRREAFLRAAGGLESALGLLRQGLGELQKTPAKFRNSMEEIAGQISGVVAAIQSHDITRQQTEHVEEVLRRLGAELSRAPVERAGAARRALLVQQRQLDNVKETVAQWTGQIRRCMEEIARIAAVGLAETGSMALRHERQLNGQLEQMEQIEETGRAGDEKLRQSLRELSGLAELVRKHVETSRVLSERLRLILFNSMVEARGLAARGATLGEISNNIRRVSGDWVEIAGEAEAAMKEIVLMQAEAGEAARIFSESGAEPIRLAGRQARGAMEGLLSAAVCAEAKGREVEAATWKLQGEIVEIEGMSERLSATFSTLDRAIAEMGAADGALEEAGAAGDGEETESWLSALYTTERERAVLRAALGRGETRTETVEAQKWDGNSVELF